MDNRKILSLLLLCFAPWWVEAKDKTPTVSLDIPFKLHGFCGHVAVSVLSNDKPERWGYKILQEGQKTLDPIVGFPVCTAKISYDGEGYLSEMAWIQFLTYTRSGDENPTVIVDRPPQLDDSKCPYLYWGPTPTFFDAPSMVSDNNSKPANVDWRADSFLVASPDAVMTKTMVPIISFSWGYKIDSKGKIEVSEAQPTNLKDWPRFQKILKQKFPDWNIRGL
jgi:hypothetical protein